jgi:hypothetical protein
MSGEKTYPTQFYARTFVHWAGCFILVPLIVFYCSVFVDPPKAQLTRGETITGVIGISLTTVLWIACIFQVRVRQTPTLKMYREGIKIRLLAAPTRFEILLLNITAWIGPVRFCVIIFLVFWQFLTLRLFQVQTFRLRWENLLDMPMEKNSFTLSGWIERDRGDFEQDAPLEQWEFPYQADSFGTPIGKVFEAVQFYQFHYDAQETLPSWQNDDTLSSKEIFDFDL